MTGPDQFRPRRHPNCLERQLGTSPRNADTDHDGLSDGEELMVGTDPSKADSDGGRPPEG